MSDTVDGPEAGFLGLLACVSFGRRSTFFAGPRASDVSFLALGRGPCDSALQARRAPLPSGSRD